MKGRILVVDDTGEIYEYCSRFLKETGFEFEWVRSGKEAQSQNLDKKYSLILLDKDFSKIPKDLLLSDNPREEGLTILKVLKKKTSLLS